MQIFENILAILVAIGIIGTVMLFVLFLLYYFGYFIGYIVTQLFIGHEVVVYSLTLSQIFGIIFVMLGFIGGYSQKNDR